MVIERHDSGCETLFLQVMITSGCKRLLISMVGEPLADPAHVVLVAGGAEGCKVPEGVRSAADHRLPEVEVC
jgi:hypothetical protein